MNAVPVRNIVYLTTMAPPRLDGTDAVMQDVVNLMDHFGGRHISLYPFRKPSRFVPYRIMGRTRRRELATAASGADILHVFSATLKPLPILASLGLPIVYTVTASLGRTPRIAWFNQNHVHVVLNNERDLMRAKEAGLQHLHLIKPGIDLSRFTYMPPPPPPPFRLLIGSAPWTRAQFITKGIDALINVAQNMSDLHLVFLWRNLWLKDLETRIRRAGIENQVTIHNCKVDVNHVLAGCHATAILAANERLVKAWPHSAIESLAAGKPVILSETIPMADFIKTNRCGAVVTENTPSQVNEAIQTLRFSRQHAATAYREQIRVLNISTLLSSTSSLYRHIINEKSAPLSQGMGQQNL